MANHLRPKLVMDEADVSVDVNSDPTNVEYQDNVSYQISWTGTPSGVIDVQFSNDYNPNRQNPALPRNDTGSWSSIGLLDSAGNPIDPSVVVSPYTIDLNQIASAWVRVQYVATAGAGDMSVVVTAKGLSGR